MQDGGFPDPDGDATRTLSRRNMLKKAGLTAGALWVVPTVLSLDVPPAAASGGFGTVVSLARTGVQSLTLGTIGGIGDVLVACIATWSNSPPNPVTGPSDWTNLSDDFYHPSNPGINMAVFAFVATSANQSYTFTWTAITRAAGWIASFPGATNWDPIGTRATSASSPITATGFNTGGPNRNLLFIGAHSGGSVTVGTPSGYTSRAYPNTGSTGAGPAAYLATKQQAAQGATGSPTATLSDIRNNIGCLLAVY